MPVMRIREMRMHMRDGYMAMWMGVACARLHRDFVLMIVVRIIRTVDMLMLVFQHFMSVLVRMSLGQVKHDANSHQCAAKQ